ncbi:MAG: hypothetical protein HC921_18300 [Synechococcaceae cyanobacterium SM2_3_1]|nr:hypothetical protein [Synechococcaceae cyanobacterium SM2_3_1]
MNSIWLKRSALPAAVLLVLLHSCGGSNGSSVTTAPVDTPTTTTANTPALEEGENGLFAVNISADAAGLIRLDIASPEPLPETISVGEATFISLPVEIVTGFRSYVASPESTTVVLEGITEIFLGVSQAEIRVSLGAEGTSFVFQNDPTAVTFEDYILVRATGDLPPALRTAANIATRANELFPAGSFTAGALNPIPDELNTDFAAGGSVPPPDLTDALVVYAATFLPPNLRTPENLAAVVNALDPSANLDAADILAIPGSSLPGGVALIQPVTERTAGTFQVSVQENPFNTPGFTIGNAAFTRLPVTIFPGFTTYVAEPSSSTLNIEFAQLEIDGVDESTCVIVHLPGQDPLNLVNQLSRTAACELPDNGLPLQSDSDALLSTLPSDFTLQILHAADQEAGTAAVSDIPRFSSVLNALAPEFPNTVKLTTGDLWIPGAFFSAGVNDNSRPSGGEADVRINSALGWQAAVLGNHEFDLGTNVLGGLLRAQGSDTTPGPYPGTTFPYLSANLNFVPNSDLSSLIQSPGQEASTIPNSLTPSTVITVNGERIGIVGATTPLLPSISSPGNVGVAPSNPTDFGALAAILQPEIDALTGTGINKIILLAHLQQIQNEVTLAGLLRDVDIIIAGGSDTLLANPDDRIRTEFGKVPSGVYPLLFNSATDEPVALINTDREYRYVGRLIVDFDELGLLSGIDDLSGPYPTDDQGVTETGNAAPTQVVVDVVNEVAGVLQTLDGPPFFGSTNFFLNGERQFVRTEETNFGNLTADANLAAAEAVDSTGLELVSIKNGGGIRASIGAVLPGDTPQFIPPAANPLTGKQSGEVSQLDIQNSLRFNNGLTLLTVDRTELKNILEHGVANIGGGQTIQVGGLSFSFDPDGTAIVFDNDGNITTAGTRVQNVVLDNGTVIVQNGMVQAGADIRLVTLNFLANAGSTTPGLGGDRYPFPAFGDNRQDLFTGSDTSFTADGREQEALANFLAGLGAPFNQEDTPVAQDLRIQNLNERSDTILP